MDIVEIKKHLNNTTKKLKHYQKKLYKCKKKINNIRFYKKAKTTDEFKNIKEKMVLEIKKENKYFDYLNSYVDGTIFMLKKMLDNNNYNLLYAYLFLLTHTLELLIKHLKVYNIYVFEEMKINNHNIYDIYKVSETSFLNLGINKDIYNELIYQIEILQNHCIEDKKTHKDIAMHYKYPLAKDGSYIVTVNFINMTNEEILNMLKEQQKLILIILDILYLGRIGYMKSICTLTEKEIKDIY